MQVVDSIYKELLANKKHRKECKVEIGGFEFGMDSLITLQTNGALYKNPSVGNSIARQIDVSLISGDAFIPRMAEIKVFVRLVCDDVASDWIPKGVFYIDTRNVDKETGVLTIHGYDAMLMLEQTYIEDGADITGWPKSMDVVAADIAELIGVEIDERSVLNTNYMVEAPLSYTMREVMGWIAAAHGGNWTITDEGKLRLITLASIPAETYYLVDDGGNYITLGWDRIVVDSGEEPTREIPEGAAKVWVGNAAASLELSRAFEPFTGVTIWYDDELAYQKGNASGRQLELDCPWATEEMAENILAAITGYSYQPYSANGALLDPAAELGDGVTVGGVYSVIATIDTTFDDMCAADISATADEEVDNEYPYENRTNREMKRKVTLGKDYYGAKITKANGLEIARTNADGSAGSRAVLNSDKLAFYTDSGTEALRFDPSTGRYSFTGDIIVDGNINMAGGTITWGENNPADGGISASQARTIVGEELVSSPIIAGGKFMDLDQKSYLQMGTASNVTAYINHYAPAYSSSKPICVMGYYKPYAVPTWVISPFGKFALEFQEGSGDYPTVYAYGDWDFSQADVSGLNGGGGDVTVIPVWG